MVRGLGTTVAEVIAKCLPIAKEISKLFRAPISLEFEKVFCPYLLLKKKKYAGCVVWGLRVSGYLLTSF